MTIRRIVERDREKQTPLLLLELVVVDVCSTIDDIRLVELLKVGHSHGIFCPLNHISSFSLSL